MKKSDWAMLVFVALMLPGVALLIWCDNPMVVVVVVAGFVAAQVMLIFDSDERNVP